ncbi:MAG: polysaccharide biosynthesis protein, partial [Culicoidibacterales bacterium]
WILGVAIPQTTVMLFTGINIVLFMTMAFVFGQYHNLWRFASSIEFFNLFLAVVIASALATILSVNLNLATIQFALVTVVSISLLMFGLRFGLRFVRREVKHMHQVQRTTKRTIIIGAGEAANSLIREVKQNPNSIYEIIGTVDDDDAKQKQKIVGIPVLGTIAELEGIVETTKVEKVILAIPSLSETKRQAIIKEVKKLDVQLKVLPRLDQMLNAKADLKQVRDVQLEELLGREIIQLDNQHLSPFIKGETVFVSGAGGSIGSELCRQISKYQPKQLIMVDIYENSLYEIQNELRRAYPDLALQALIGSIRDMKRLDVLFERYHPTLVFHAAAHKHVPLMEASPKEAIKNNVFGTFNMATCAHKYGVKRFVMISTDKAVNPTNVMGATKRVCEMIVQA